MWRITEHVLPCTWNAFEGHWKKLEIFFFFCYPSSRFYSSGSIKLKIHLNCAFASIIFAIQNWKFFWCWWPNSSRREWIIFRLIQISSPRLKTHPFYYITWIILFESSAPRVKNNKNPATLLQPSKNYNLHD